MTKAELISRIVDSFDDMSGEYPGDYLDMDPITLEEATMYLAEQRAMEKDCDLEPDECLPEEVTPELYMEAENYYINHMKFEARVERFAEYLTDHECVCEHDQYFGEYQNDDPCVVPTDFLCNELRGGFYFDDDVSIDDIIEIGMNSKASFRFSDSYCWFDKDKKQLFSSNTPFADGVIDAEAMARFILLDADALGYFLDSIMDDDEIVDVFGCTKEEYIHE